MRDIFVLSSAEQLHLSVSSRVEAWRGLLAHSPVLYAHVTVSLPGREVKNDKGCLQVPDTQGSEDKERRKGKYCLNHHLSVIHSK